MQSTPPPALADAADLLSGQLRRQLKRLAQLLRPRAPALERRFLARLKRAGFDQRQAKALAAITPATATRILSGRRRLADVIEQVEYSGRRLAKLGVTPGRIAGALRGYDLLLAPLLRPLAPREAANLRWALEQLHFCVLLTLNNAFYQVREAETEAYQELFRAELESRNLDELLHGMLGALARFCRAAGAALYLADDDSRHWRLRTLAPRSRRSGPSEVAEVTPATARRLSRPQCATGKARRRSLALSPLGLRGGLTCWSVPLATGGRCRGVIQFLFPGRYEWLPREKELLSTAAERCLLAAEKARLAEDLSRREDQVRRLAEQILDVEERERRRISSELHDETGQSLLCIRLQLEMLERIAPAELREGLAEARVLAEHAVVEIRRLIADLSPAVLEQLGLAAALRQLVNRFRRFHRGKISLHVSRLGDIPGKLGMVVYRLAQECLNNVARHASASRVMVSLESADGVLRLRVEDDGVGFDVEQALAKRDSFGLVGMRERATLFGGKFHVRSKPKQGTRILIEMPIR